jgi:anti-anti-sigma regulatory factor
MSMLPLPAYCATVAAQDLHGRLLEVSVPDELSIDAGQVEHVGQAMLQLLVAARREATANGRSFAIIHPSPAFVARVRACRLDEALGLPVEGETIP